MTATAFKNARVVKSSWLEEGGRRLDCNPYMSGALEVRDALKQLSVPKQRLGDLTRRIFHAGREGRDWVDTPQFGVPFVGSGDILNADLSGLPLISKKQVERNPLFSLDAGWTLITRSGTIGRMVYVRPDMVGLACSEHVLRVVPDTNKIPSGYLFAFMAGKCGVPLVVAGTYGAIIQHIEPSHIEGLPVPRFGSPIEDEIHNAVEKAAYLRTQASQILRECSRTLEETYQLDEAGLARFRLARRGFSVQASDIRETGRLEATYHDAMVQEVERRIAHAPSKRIDEVATVVKAGIFKRLKVDGPEWGYGFITGSELFTIAPKPIYWVSPRTNHIGDCILDPYWVLIQAYGQVEGLLGHCMLTTPALKGFAATELQIQLRAVQPADAGYLFAFLSTYGGVRLLKRVPIGGSIPHIHPEDVKAIRVPWPDQDLRRSIGERVISAWNMRDEATALEDAAIGKLEAKVLGRD